MTDEMKTKLLKVGKALLIKLCIALVLIGIGKSLYGEDFYITHPKRVTHEYTKIELMNEYKMIEKGKQSQFKAIKDFDSKFVSLKKKDTKDVYYYSTKKRVKTVYIRDKHSSFNPLPRWAYNKENK